MIKPKVDLVTDLEFNRAVLTIIPTFRLYSYKIYRQLSIIVQVLLQGRHVLVPIF